MKVPRILLVDDYPDALEVWSVYLQMCGFEVSTAADGLAALQVAHDDLPDLAIVDLELPKLGGMDVARRLRANPETASMPLIAITGHSDPRQLDNARRAGFDLAFTKPCDPDFLREEIHRLLSMNGSASADAPDVTLNR